METERAARVPEIVAAALDQPAATRADFVRAACAGDEELRREVESLLGEVGAEAAILEGSALEFAPQRPELRASELRPGESLAGYRVVSLLGEGGMGRVYLAEEVELGRKVALKLVRSALGGGAAVTRHFQREARILAGLNHPNIAKLHRAGVSAEGAPFFAMEYVEGRPLDQFCREEPSDLASRLRLFRKICAAVAHAHQHLVIHRDLKPANIRVTAAGEPMLLDFGIARLLDADATGEETGSIAQLMTPAYASPEQLRRERMTTASDVYSLGVILCEMLAGARPYRLTTRRVDEVVQAILSGEPERPSALLPRTGGSAARARRRALEGDLDNIVLLALRKEPARRYPSAAELGAEIDRYLSGQPVRARRETFRYVAGKFVRRHQLGVGATLLVFLALLGGLIAAVWSARVAQRERLRAEGVSAFLMQVFEVASPLRAGPSDSRQGALADMLDAAVQRLENEGAKMSPEVRAEMYWMLARAYNHVGRYDLSRRFAQEFVDLQETLTGPGDPRTVLARAFHGALLFDRGDLAGAEKIYRAALPRLRELQRRGKVAAALLAENLNNFGYIRRTQGDSREAEAAFREMLALGPQLPRESRHLVGITLATLASTLADSGRFGEALATAREAVAEARRDGAAASGWAAFTLTVLGGFLTEAGEWSEAASLLQESERILRQTLATSTLWLGDNLRNQAILALRQERFAEAEALAREAAGIYLQAFGAHYDHYPTTQLVLGLAQARSGRVAEGEPILRAALKQRSEDLAADHFWVAEAEGALGECLRLAGRPAEAEPLLRSRADKLQRAFGAADPRAARAARELR
ncbi:MAG: serine/threonine protein kinase [Verrucomicrobia bacterium]|nr:serine/threonine protein kinase [Verrucomicrobiota bacterium]